MKMPVNVAVYGTLRRGFGNHSLLDRADFVGKGKTENQYTLTASGIPFVTEGLNEGLSNVTVEVYSVTTQEELSRLDSLEGHPSWYERREIPVILENGEKVNAWLYFNDPSGTIIPTGDYEDYRRPRIPQD